MNHNYAKIVTPQKLEYAPDALELEGKRLQLNPSDADYIAAGWLPVKLSPPKPPAGQQVATRSFVDADGHIDYKYEYQDIPPRDLELSKRKLMNNLKAIELPDKTSAWVAVKAWMEASGFIDDWEVSTTLMERDPMMQEAIAALPALGLAPERIDEILINSEVY